MGADHQLSSHRAALGRVDGLPVASANGRAKPDDGTSGRWTRNSGSQRCAFLRADGKEPIVHHVRHAYAGTESTILAVADAIHVGAEHHQHGDAHERPELAAHAANGGVAHGIPDSGPSRG